MQRIFLLALAACAPWVTTACAEFLCDPESDPQCLLNDRGHIQGKVLLPQATAAAASTQPRSTHPRSTLPTAVQDARDVLRTAVRQVRPHKSLVSMAPTSPRKAPTSAARPGELIVTFAKDARGQRSQARSTLQNAADAVGLDVVVELPLCNTSTSCLSTLRTRHGKVVDDDALAQLASLWTREPAVRAVEYNLELQALRVPNDDFYNMQWHYSAIHLDAAWDITTGDDALTVAVVDTGILVDHPDLRSRIVGGADLINDATVAGDGDGRDDDGNDAGDQACGPNCHSHHGSHVAGTIAADTDNGIMVSGVTWQGGVLAVRVLGNGGGSLFDIAGGILWSIGEDVEGVQRNTRPADVVNLSLGGPGDSQTMNDAVQAAIDSGAIVVVAAGNDDVDASSFTPANAPGAIVVGAVGHRGGDRDVAQRASYSNFGTIVDVMAPGGEQLEDIDGDGHVDGVLSTTADFVSFLQGTSMAAPHVSGVAMLLKSVRPQLRQDEVRALLTSSADDRVQCSQGCGAGRVDALGALRELTGVSNAPFVVAEPSLTNIGQGDLDAEVTFRNVGDVATDVELFIAGTDKEKVTVDFEQSTLNVEGELHVAVAIDRTGDDEGEADLIAVWGDDTSTVARLRWTADVLPLAGSVLIGALREWPGGELEVQRLVTTDEFAGWDYTLFNLEPGSYLVMGLSDDDNDAVFEDHEGIGVYPSVQEPQLINVAVGQTNTAVDFLVAPGVALEDIGAGNGDIGAACETSADCAGGLYCDRSFFPGGYCSTSCSGDVPCPAGSACFCLATSQGGCDDGICLQTCMASSECREDDGYVCDADMTCYPSGT